MHRRRAGRIREGVLKAGVVGLSCGGLHRRDAPEAVVGQFGGEGRVVGPHARRDRIRRHPVANTRDPPDSIVGIIGDLTAGGDDPDKIAVGVVVEVRDVAIAGRERAQFPGGRVREARCQAEHAGRVVRPVLVTDVVLVVDALVVHRGEAGTGHTILDPHQPRRIARVGVFQCGRLTVVSR
ncbi:hypothetical protein SDC9_90740 [bioreactor metagenome]|uniref:Uncharacterized protein n=1 Tax=bioreactor metagenome TaxID=1076179 RepID=A0A644ZT77_9ZZZZ